MNLPPYLGTLKSGALLISDPSLRDGVFNRTVILLAEHSSEGAFGMIMNRPSGNFVGDFLKDEEFSKLARVPVHVGGPVAREHLTFSAFWYSPDNELRYAVRISANEAKMHLNNPGTLVRAFVGYSGWSAGQLEGEIESNSWIATEAPTSLLSLEHDESLWNQTLSPLSAYHNLLAICPENPWLN